MLDFATDVARLAVWLVLLVAIFVPLERVAAVHPAPLRRAGWLTDLGWYFINSLLPAAIIVVPLAALARGLQGLDPLGLYSAVLSLPVLAKLALALAVNDFGAYWMHRWQHSNALMWRFHAVHHSAPHMDWLVNTRAHPVDMVLVRLAGLIPVYLLGLASAKVGFDPVVAWVTIIGTIWSFFIHANVRWRLGWLERLVSTPAFHHWHHSLGQPRDRNFAAILPIYDRMFGTLHLPDALPAGYGIDTPMPDGIAGQFAAPFRREATPPALVAEGQ